MTIKKQIGWGLLLFFAFGIAFVNSRYLMRDPATYFPQQVEVYLTYELPLMAHIVGGIVALVLGPFQFMTRLRNRRPGLHRWIGRIYLLGILAGGLGGAFMAFHAWGGWIARSGFFVMAVLWLATTWQAYATIRRGEVSAHRVWMLRNYALTFAAVTLRLEGPLLGVAGVSELLSYQIIAWSCWVLNLIVVELWLRRRDIRPLGAAVGTAE